MAQRGPSGRPTLVNNAETVAQVAMLVRSGPAAWRAAGTPSSPGPQLVTLAGGIAQPGPVLEVVGTATMGMVLRATGLEYPPAAVLVGGYAGTWIRGHEAWNCWLDRDELGRLGASPGCGLIGVLPHGYCGLAETARLVEFLAGETAGQCGPCVRGLPDLAEACRSLADGTLRRRGLRRLLSLAGVVDGGGACSHPDGVVRLIRSALVAFADDVTRHLSGDICVSLGSGPVFPVPEVDAAGREWS
jgi:NADH:ubiquinone oxidoreductase subunit F (NADH-binding)